LVSRPNPKVLLNRKFRVNRVGPVAGFTGIIFWPALGTVLKVPRGVQRTVGVRFVRLEHVAVDTKPGLSLKIESPFRSVPVVMSYG